MTSEVRLSAIAEVTIDGQLHISQEIPFTLAGVTLVLDVVKTADGTASVRVRAGPPSRQGSASFDKTCPEWVVYKIFRNGEPLQMVELRSMFGGTALDLSKAA